MPYPARTKSQSGGDDASTSAQTADTSRIVFVRLDARLERLHDADDEGEVRALVLRRLLRRQQRMVSRSTSPMSFNRLGQSGWRAPPALRAALLL